MKIAFIGFGEAARAFHETLAKQDAMLAFTAYDILLDREGADSPCAQGMRERGVEIAATPEANVAGADWIVSAVTADQSLAAVEAAAPHLRPGQIFFDINSVSPDRKRQWDALVAPSGAIYIDMAVMAPVHPKGHRTPVLLAGKMSDELLGRIKALDFDFQIAGPEAGAATAIKMVRSLFVKGLEAITVETMLAASASGRLDYVLNSLSRSYPGLGWPDIVSYHLERTLKHGTRRAAEMQESAATLDALGLDGDLARAIAWVQASMGALPNADLESRPLAENLATVLTRRLHPKPGR